MSSNYTTFRARTSGVASAASIIATVAAAHGMLPRALTSDSRTARIVQARHIAMWICRRREMTYQQIGHVFSSHHTSVIHGVQKINDLMNRPEIAEDLAALERSALAAVPPKLLAYKGRISRLAMMERRVSELERVVAKLTGDATSAPQTPGIGIVATEAA